MHSRVMGALAETSKGGGKMSNAMPTEIGAVVSLWRYPVKSMLGEELQTAPRPRAARRSGIRLARSRRWEGRHGQESQKMAEPLRVPGHLHRALGQQRAGAAGPHDAARW